MTTISDDFNRSDETLTDDAAWEGSGDPAIVSNEVEAPTSTSVSYVQTSTATGDEDMYAQLVLKSLPADHQSGPCVRNDTGSSYDGYMMMWTGFESDICYVRRTDGSSRTDIAGPTTAAAVVDDVIYVEAEGSAIEGRIVGTETESTTDTTYGTTSDDHGGMYFYANNSGAPTIDDFEAGQLSADATATPTAINPTTAISASYSAGGLIVLVEGP